MARSPQLKGAACGLTAALLFGVSAPLSKLLLPGTGPLLLASLLYLGGGLGLLVFGALRRLARAAPAAVEARVTRADVPLLAGVIVFGGMIGPVLMLMGLARLSGVAASLLLNLEGPLTVLVAIAFFREHLGRRGLIAATLTFAGATLLSVGPGKLEGELPGVLCIVGACGAWALDNNLSQRLSLKSPVQVVRLKALGAGGAMGVIALIAGQRPPALPVLAAALALGAASYGLSIVLDLYALRLLGAAREAAYFAAAPFLGALAAVPLLGERLRLLDVTAGALMAAGVVLLLRERHGHLHTHEPLEHEHLHVHDAHHRHDHAEAVAGPHSHPHRHAALTHDHPHVSDLHHRHRH